MIKRTQQEIADFFGCKVQVNPYTSSANLWDANDEIKECVGCLNHQLMHMSNTDDDKLTYEHQEKQENSGNKDGSYYQDSENSDNKHQSEVHTHKEYCVIKNETPAGLSKQATKLIDKGYKPVGGISIGYEYGACPRQYFYQAMVRGV